MSLWVSMLICNLLIPVIMIIFGSYSCVRPAGKINSFIGYRTTMSMKNQDTWQFAHRHSGRIWRKMGWIMLPISLVCMLLLLNRSENTVSIVSLVLCMAELIALIASIFPTERALRKNFDKNGNRKQ